jgi:hypothetical protein
LPDPLRSIRRRRYATTTTTNKIRKKSLSRNRENKKKTFLSINQLIDFGRIAWQEFKGGGDITEGGIMVLMDRNKRNCSEPHRVHGSLVFRDGEPKEGEKKWAEFEHLI